MNLVRAILLKIASALLFALMQALVRWLGEGVPLGQVVFFRSAFAIVPVVLIYAWQRELAAAVRPTGRSVSLGAALSVSRVCFSISPRWLGCRLSTRLLSLLRRR
jgi:hypothetical protein